MKKFDVSKVAILLKSLVYLLKNGSLRAAAKAMKLSPSTVSGHIKNLEHTLEFRITTEQDHKTVLTENGKKMAKLALPLINALNFGFIKKAIALESKLKVSVYSQDMRLCFLLAKTVHLQPNDAKKFQISVNSFNLKEVIERIRRGEIDAAFMPLLQTEAGNIAGDIKTVKISNYKIALCCSKTHPLLKLKRRINFNDISKYPILKPTRDFLIAKFFGWQNSSDVIFDTDNTMVLEELIASGNYISFFERKYLSAFKYKELAIINCTHLFPAINRYCLTLQAGDELDELVEKISRKLAR